MGPYCAWQGGDCMAFASPTAAPSGLGVTALWSQPQPIPSRPLWTRAKVGPALFELRFGRGSGSSLYMAGNGDKMGLGSRLKGDGLGLRSRVSRFNKNEGPQSVVMPDFRLPLTVLGIGLYLLKDQCQGWGILFSVVGAFLTLQTARLRFRFSKHSIDVLKVNGLTETGAASESNDRFGTEEEKRRVMGPWDYSSIVNWDFWWPGFPVLAYFKETQTKETGQKHFFPVIMDGKQVYEQMLENFGRSQTHKPSVEEWDDLRPLSPTGFARCKAYCYNKVLEIDRRFQIRTRTKAIYRLVRQAKWSELKAMAKQGWVLVLGYLVQAQKAVRNMISSKSRGQKI
mmetsp:Transcript_4877/g.7828  ORF Transcript_4877/g.7828 Transcript_4877/m.7828 type:complete len:341 (-) Transcript_4877:859-1881(-)